MTSIEKFYLYGVGTLLGIFSFCLLVVVAILGLVALPIGKNGRQFYYNQLIAIDQLFNVHYCGDPDETISSRRGKGSSSNLLRRFIDLLFGKDHCTNYVESDEGNKSIR